MNHSLVEKGMRLILKGLNCDLSDRNFQDTPERYARAMDEMFNPPELDAVGFPEKYTDFVLLRNHRMHSLCPHHMFAVEFNVSLAYIPNGEVLGLSKLARLLHDVNRGPLLQEKFTRDAILKVHEILSGVRGVACLIEGRHDCARIRGVHTTGDFTTYKMDGMFEEPTMEHRFFQVLGRR